MNLITMVFLMVLLAVSPAGGDDFWDLDPGRSSEEAYVYEFVDSMTDDEMLGQILLLGYEGTSPSEEFLRWIRERKIGGVKIFGWNVGTLTSLAQGIGDMQTEAGRTRLAVPLFVATDQEGGWVRHVKGDTSITAGNLALGAGGNPMDAYRSGHLIGTELRTLGINMNFAPTVDVYTNPLAHVIGPRAFSEDPVQTAYLATAYYRGMQNAGIICTAKHFPGHGNSDQDSHGVLPILQGTFDDIWSRELVPYRLLIREGLPAVMSGHLNYPEITGPDLPATLSQLFLTEILRKRMGFKGIVITDDMRMDGVLMKGMSTPEVCAEALVAGNDLLMISRDVNMHERIWRELRQRMRTDEAFRNRVREAAMRILTLKLDFLAGEGSVPLEPDLESVRTSIPDPGHEGYLLDLACRSTTVIRDRLIPFEPGSGGRVLLAGQFREFLDEGMRRIPGAVPHYLSYSPFYRATASEVAEFRRLAERYDTIIFGLANPRSLAILSGLEDLADRVIVISVLTPVYLRETPWVQTSLAVYGTGYESFQAGFGALLGDFVPQGVLPITIY